MDRKAKIWLSMKILKIPRKAVPGAGKGVPRAGIGQGSNPYDDIVSDNDLIRKISGVLI